MRHPGYWSGVRIALQGSVCINTVLARKHYSVLYLRNRLQTVYDELDLLRRRQMRYGVGYWGRPLATGLGGCDLRRART